jgi:hypothetical protein
MQDRSVERAAALVAASAFLVAVTLVWGVHFWPAFVVLLGVFAFSLVRLLSAIRAR